MSCARCPSDGPLLCESCVRTLVDRVAEDERRRAGACGFIPPSQEGIDMVRFLLEWAEPAVGWLHAGAAAMRDPGRSADARRAADELHAACKRAREALLRTG